MAENKQTDLIEEGKGAVEDLFRSIGLLDLILGSLVLYWIWLWYGTRVSNLFPSTHINFVDIGLLAFGASLVGRAVLLAVVTWMMLMLKIVETYDISYYYSETCKALENLTGRSKPPGKEDVYGLSLEVIALTDPTQRILLERIRTRVIIAYSATLLAVPYIIYLVREKAPGLIVAGMGIGVLVLGLLGFLEQLDYLGNIKTKLVALLLKKQSEKETQ